MERIKENERGVEGDIYEFCEVTRKVRVSRIPGNICIFLCSLISIPPFSAIIPFNYSTQLCNLYQKFVFLDKKSANDNKIYQG